MNQDAADIKILDPEEGGKPPVETKAPESAPPPAAVPPVNPEPTKIPGSAEPLNKDTTPPGPTGIVKKEEPTPAAPPLPGSEPPAGTPSRDSVFSEDLSALTDGHLKTKDDLVGILQHYNELLTQAEEGFKPKFKDERAKKVHQILADSPGMEPAAAMRTLRALNFNPEGKTSKDYLFEAYLLDPKNSDLSESRAARLFEEEYNETYGDIEGNDRKQRNLELSVKEAKATIDKIQGDFKSIEEAPARISKEVEETIQKVASSFGGIRIPFTDNPTEMDYLNVPVNDPKVLASLQEIALNPKEASDRFISQFATQNGYDYPAYFQALYERENAPQLRQQAYDHGYKQGQLAKTRQIANASEKKDIADSGGAPPSSAPKSVSEAWAKAIGVGK